MFPLGSEWLKEEASGVELETFKLWKEQMREWYTQEAKRVGRKAGILARLRELIRYQAEAELYFPTFIDWRGRMYFRSVLNPQSNDAVKGCLEFSEGKPLGAEGLFWLKVHVANSCGYDKHSPAIKAKWTEDNWEMICDFINNPLDVDAPEPGYCLHSVTRRDWLYKKLMPRPIHPHTLCPRCEWMQLAGLQHLYLRSQ